MPSSRVPTRAPSTFQLPLLLLLLTATTAFVQAFHHLPSLPRHQQQRTTTPRTTNPLTRHSLYSNPNHSNDRKTSSPPPPLTLPGTTLALRHPKTNSQVFIVGCVHGSEASEQDVTTVITGQGADIILLELCEDRFQSMQAEEAKQRARALAFQKQQEAQAAQQQTNKKSTTPSFPLISTAGLSDFTTNLKEFFNNHGVLPTILVVLLSSSAEVQRILTNTHTHNRNGGRVGSRPSCEFRKSVELAEAQKAKIVLGDQDLSVTLQRFKDGLRPQWLGARGGADIDMNEQDNESFPSTSTSSSSSNNNKPSSSLLAELASIRNAVLGPPGLPAGKKVDVLRLLFTQERYIRELVKVLIPVALVVLLTLQILESAGDMAIATLHHIVPATFSSFFSLLEGATNGGVNMDVDAISTAATSSSSSSSNALLSFLDSSTFEDLGWALVNVGMVFYFLSLNRHILFERDVFLANSIAEAAGGKNEGKKVVAVLGLLHGNGVGRHLCERHGFEIVERF